jgi:hypothetical protein
MLEEIEERLYTNLPERLQPFAQKWYYVANPGLSWQYRKKPDEVDESFVDRFFDDRAEYDRYEEEFANSGVGEICMNAERKTDEGYTIFDSHRKDCFKYYALVRKYEPEVLVESGVYSGVSTLSVLVALAENGHGHLHSVDNSSALRGHAGQRDDRSEHYRRERPSCSEPGSSRLEPGRDPGWIVPDRLRDRWTLREGRSQSELPELLVELETVDWFVHDSEHTVSCMLFEFESVWERLSPGGIMLSSHIQWNDAFETFVDEHDCESGLTTFHYLGYEGEKVPCSTGYVRKPSR